MEDSQGELAHQVHALNQSAIVAETDARGTITRVNELFCRISGYARDELVGKNHRVLNSGVHSHEFFRTMWREIQAGRVWRGEICNRKKSGEIYWVATTITPFRDAMGRPYRYLAIRQDITDLKLAEQRIREQELALADNFRLGAMGELAAAVTHEINNPLAVVLGRAEMIQNLIDLNRTDPPVLRQLAATIETTGRRIERIVRGMRELSHRSAEGEPFHFADLMELIDDATELCRERFRAARVDLRFNRPSHPTRFECRGFQIVQILVNLLNNSYDAIRELDERWIEIEVQVGSSYLQVAISDSGPGIAGEVLRQIFTPFFSTKGVRAGSGLGLSISRNLAAQHGGTLDYEVTGGHTRFVVRLPRRQPTEQSETAPR